MTNSSNNKSDDDATRVIFRKGPQQDTVIMPDRAGYNAPSESATPSQTGPAPAGSDATVFIPAMAGEAQPNQAENPVVGWVVVMDGPGRGNYRPVHYGQNSLGRGDEQRITLDFGDARISRETHAYLIYDEVERKFFLRDNGKSNVVRLNGEMLLGATELHDRDLIAIGQTTLLFVALCGQSFDWLASDATSSA